MLSKELQINTLSKELQINTLSLKWVPISQIDEKTIKYVDNLPIRITNNGVIEAQTVCINPVNIENIVPKKNGGDNMIILTHSNRFHTDDVMAVMMCLLLFPNAIVIRTRNKKLFDLADIVLDVGGIYDFENNRYDHHQPDCIETYFMCKTLLSSAGMLFKYYSAQILMAIIGEEEFKRSCKDILVIQENNKEDKLTEEEYNNTYKLIMGIMTNYIYHNMIKEIDAADNGEFSGNSIVRTGICLEIPTINSGDVYDEKLQLHMFAKAMNICKDKFVKKVRNRFSLLKTFAKDKKYLLSCIGNLDNKNKPNPLFDNKILYLKKPCDNWKKIVETIEGEEDNKTEFTFIIYPSNPNGTEYTLKAIPKTRGDRYSRKVDIYSKENIELWCKQNSKTSLAISMLKEWNNIIFVHKSSFLLKAKNINTTLIYAKICLSIYNIHKIAGFAGKKSYKKSYKKPHKKYRKKTW